MMGTTGAPYVIAAYALTAVVIAAYVASIRARRHSVRQDLAAAREALEGEAGEQSGKRVLRSSDLGRAEDDLDTA